ncbi:unnamed protein product, partial [Owenia fusiformis]
RGLQLDGPGNDANAFSNDAMDTQPAIGRPTYGSTPVYSILGKRMKDDPSNWYVSLIEVKIYKQVKHNLLNVFPSYLFLAYFLKTLRILLMSNKWFENRMAMILKSHPIIQETV